MCDHVPTGVCGVPKPWKPRPHPWLWLWAGCGGPVEPHCVETSGSTSAESGHGHPPPPRLPPSLGAAPGAWAQNIWQDPLQRHSRD